MLAVNQLPSGSGGSTPSLPTIIKEEGAVMRIPKPSKTVWTVITGLVVVLSLVGGIYKFDDRYAKAEDLKSTRNNMEQRTVQTFESFQMKQQTVTDGLRLDILNIEYERTKKELRNAKSELRKHPNDVDIEMEIEELKQRIDYINDKRKALREKLTGVGG